MIVRGQNPNLRLLLICSFGKLYDICYVEQSDSKIYDSSRDYTTASQNKSDILIYFVFI